MNYQNLLPNRVFCLVGDFHSIGQFLPEMRLLKSKISSLVSETITKTISSERSIKVKQAIYKIKKFPLKRSEQWGKIVVVKIEFFLWNVVEMYQIKYSQL